MPTIPASQQFRRYSFSGADARAYVYFPRAPDLFSHLESVQTISVSVHEAKGDARALGYRAVKGFAQGVRTVAGTMILTVVNDHPLRPLLKDAAEYESRFGYSGWSVDYYKRGVGSARDAFEYLNRMPTLIPEFNLLVEYVTEQGIIRTVEDQRAPGGRASDIAYEYEGHASWLVEGIEIIDVGMVTSVHDIVTELTISFKAQDFKPLSQQLNSTLTLVPEDGLQGDHFELMDRLFPLPEPTRAFGTDSEGGDPTADGFNAPALSDKVIS